MGDVFEFTDPEGGEVRLAGKLLDPGATTGDVLTVQADKSIAAAPGGGGGSAFTIATLDLSAAQLLALNATPQTVIAAPGASKAIMVAGTMWLYTRGAVSYTVGGGGGAPFQLGWGANADLDATYDPSSSFITGAASRVYGQLGGSSFLGGNDQVATAVINQPFVLIGPDPLADGDGSVTLHVAYWIADFA